MDCTRCAQMLDDPDRALADAASRGDAAEADPCCRETLALLRLERGVRRIMPMHEPHASLDAMILRAAAARVSGAAPVLAAAAPTLADPASSKSWVARLRSWVTAPQVAMATITALAVVIGVFYVPSGRSPMQADGDTVMQVAPSAATESSAEPIPLELGPPSQIAAAPKPDSNAQAPADAPTTVALNDDAARADTDQMIAALAQPQVEEIQAPSEAQLAMAEREAPAAESLDRMAAPSPSPATPPAAMRSAARSTTTSTATAPAAPTAAPMSGDATVAGSDALVRARVLRSRGQCAAAIPLYEQWLAAPTGGSRGDAMLELAGCYESTGRHNQARLLYERASGVPQVASRARAELESLDAADEAPPPAATRASGRTASEARSGAAAPPPASAAEHAY